MYSKYRYRIVLPEELILITENRSVGMLSEKLPLQMQILP